MSRNFFASAGDTTIVPRSFRFRLRVLLVRMCRLNAFARTIFPDAVFLKRFAAPRCVFSFGIWLSALSFQLSDSSSSSKLTAES